MAGVPITQYNSSTSYCLKREFMKVGDSSLSGVSRLLAHYKPLVIFPRQIAIIGFTTLGALVVEIKLSQSNPFGGRPWSIGLFIYHGHPLT